MKTVDWATLKDFATTRSVSLQWVDLGESYWIVGIDGPFQLECSLVKLLNVDETAEFEGDLKLSGNARVQPTVNGLPITRPATTKPGWHYCPRYFTWTTAKYPSDIHNRTITSAGFPAAHSMSDLTDGTVRWWKLSGLAWVELKRSDYVSDLLFVAALLAECTITTMEWHSTFDFDIVGCGILNGLQPGAELWGYVVAAPDVPTASGGTIPFLDGGFPFHLLASYQFVDFNGITVKTVTADPTYKTNKFRIVLEHAVGAQIAFSMGFKKFNA